MIGLLWFVPGHLGLAVQIQGAARGGDRDAPTTADRAAAKEPGQGSADRRRSIAFCPAWFPSILPVLVWWKFREALDPDQPDGSAIALPPDPELRTDLCAPTWKLGARGILLESKDGSSGFGNLRQRLGRSPGKGDAVVMAWSEGNAAAVSRHNAWKWERPRQRWIV